MKLEVQKVPGGISLNNLRSTSGETIQLTYKQAESVAHTLLKMVELHKSGKKK